MSERIFDFQEPMDERRICIEIEDDVEECELAGIVLAEIIEPLRDALEMDPPAKFSTQPENFTEDWKQDVFNAMKRAAANFKGATLEEWKHSVSSYLIEVYETKIIPMNESDTVGNFYYEDWAEETFMMRDEVIELFERMESAAEEIDMDSDLLRDEMEVEVREYVAMIAEEIDPTSIFDVVEESWITQGFHVAERMRESGKLEMR